MQTLLCDSCDKPIADMNNRASVLLYTPEPIADPQLDLCGACAAAIGSDPKVKKARAKAMERIRNWMPPVVQSNPTGEPLDDYEPQEGDGPARRPRPTLEDVT